MISNRQIAAVRLQDAARCNVQCESLPLSDCTLQPPQHVAMCNVNPTKEGGVATTLVELFSQLNSRGLGLQRVGPDTIRIKGPVSAIDETVKDGVRAHKEKLLNLIPDHTVAIETAVSELYSWLNRAKPPAYDPDDHPDYWIAFYADLNRAADSGSLGETESTIDQLKRRAVEHFLPHHPLADSTTYWPDHSALDLNIEQLFERRAIQWTETAPAEEVDQAVEQARQELFQIMFEDEL